MGGGGLWGRFTLSLSMNRYVSHEKNHDIEAKNQHFEIHIVI